MTQVKTILAYLEQLAPVAMKLDFDNVGLLTGRSNSSIQTALLALDITTAVIDEAIALGAGLILSHHPIILSPLHQMTDANLQGQKLLKLARHDIASICMHTNLDAATGGINDLLAARLDLSKTELLWKTGELNGTPFGLGRVGTLASPIPMSSFLPQVQARLKSHGLRYHDAGRPVHKLAVMGGSGSDLVKNAAAMGCDTYLLGEVKYHAFLEAAELGLNLIEADHYCTENIIIEALEKILSEAFSGLNVQISTQHKQVAQFFPNARTF